jgi:hypothetical protein
MGAASRSTLLADIVAEEPDDLGRRGSEMRPFERRVGSAAAGQGHTKMPVALESGHQVFEVPPPVIRVRKACQRASDDLLADLQRRIHLGPDRTRGIEKDDCAFDRKAHDQDDCNQAEQAKSKRHPAGWRWKHGTAQGALPIRKSGINPRTFGTFLVLKRTRR